METKIFTGTPNQVEHSMNQWLKGVKGLVKIISITSAGHTYSDPAARVHEWTQVVVVFIIKPEEEEK